MSATLATKESGKKTAQKKIVVILPAYNAAATLERTIADIPPDFEAELVLVDDASADDTTRVANELGLRTITHPHNVGYGGNQKTCYLEALRMGADIVVMLHPDYQYDPRKLPELVAPIISGRADVVLGSRLLGGGALRGGMPLYKFVSNRFLTACQNLVLGTSLSEFHTGYRAYSRQVLETIPFLRNSLAFVFDAQVLCQSAYFGFRIDEIAVETRYFPEASSINFLSSIKYGIGVLQTLLSYISAKQKVFVSALYKS